MSVISYTLEKCQKCMACIRICPTEALSMQHQRIQINREKCINCGQCLDACVHQGLQAKGSTLDDLAQYEKRIALLPPAVFGECHNHAEIEQLMHTFIEMGFDEVVELSSYEAAIYDHVQLYRKDNPGGYLISSFCPVVNRLIEMKYPMLLSNMIPFELTAEIAAKRIRQQHENENVGIFYLCECIAKLPLGKFPYGNKRSEIDHCVSLVDLFPKIARIRNTNRLTTDICAKGICAVASELFVQDEILSSTIVADGLKKVQLVLDLAEFGQLKGEHLLWLSNCINGCIGGNLLWGNPFEASINSRRHYANANGTPIVLSDEEIIQETVMFNRANMKSLKERMAEFTKINEQLEKLPGYDCGACGYPSCRVMAEEIVAGQSTIADCRIIHVKEI